MGQDYEPPFIGEYSFNDRFLYRGSILPSFDPEISRIRIKLKKKIMIDGKRYRTASISSSRKRDGIITKGGISHNFINGLLKIYPPKRIMLIIEKDKKGDIIYTPIEHHPSFATEKSSEKSVEEKTEQECTDGLESMIDD